jgi:cytochrome c-type biogenesis protein CcmH/NrfG
MPPGSPDKPVLALRAGLVAASVLLAGLLFWSRSSSPDIAYLARHEGVSWVLFPSAVNPGIHAIADQTAVFTREFSLERVSPDAVLHYRACSRATIRLNGQTFSVEDTAGAHWKQPVRLPVSERLVLGSNTLVITVTHDTGPPAVWFNLQCGDERIVSDTRCQATLNGSLPLPARVADERPTLRPGHPLWHDERLPVSLARSLGTLLLLMTVAITLVLLAERCFARDPVVLGRTISRTHLFGGTVALVWLGLFGLNSQSLTVPIGFDVDGHLAHIDHVRSRWSPPLPGDHWEAHQPTVYYFLLASLLNLTGWPTASPAGVLLVRGATFLVALVQIGLIAAILSHVFGERRTAVVAGTTIAAALPLHTLQAHNVGNDLLAATLSTAALLIALRILTNVSTAIRSYTLLGALFGLAILTKLTTLPLAATTALFVAIHAVARGRSLSFAAPRVASVFFVTALLCGWFFARNYWHYGQFLVGNYDPISGFRWWQEPGYTTFRHWTSFGGVFLSPFQSSITHGIPDGIYSSLWGDGGWAGALHTNRPPWNYDLMTVGYLVALVPASLIVVGAVRSVWYESKRSTWCGAYLLCAVAAQSLALCHFVSQHPGFGCIKGLFLLPIVPAVCVWASSGFDLVSGIAGWRRRAAASLLGFWALLALTSVCIAPSSAETLTFRGRQALFRRDIDAARDFAERATSTHPTHARGWELLGDSLLEQGNLPLAARALLEAVRLDPGLGGARVGLATALHGLGDITNCDRQLREAVEQSPEHLDAHVGLATRLLSDGHLERGIEAARTGLCIAPTSIELHELLGNALLDAGNVPESIHHDRYALRFGADSPDLLLRLAWLLAATEGTHPTDIAETQRLVEQVASAPGRFDEPSVLRVQAALLAAQGQFAEAVTTINRCRRSFATKASPQTARELEAELRTYSQRQPLRLTATELRSRQATAP